MAESEEALQLKRRARRRLVGAIALVTFVVIILPLILDKEPGPAGPPLSVQIPNQDSGSFNSRVLPPAPAPAPAAEPAPEQKAEVSAVKTEPPPAKAEASAAKTETPTAKTETPPAKYEIPPAKTAPAAAAAVPMVPAQPAVKAEEGRAQAALNDQFWAVTLDAFADAKNAKQLRARLTAAGVKSYTEPVKTSKGELTRVRAGPFASKEAAEGARAKLVAMGLKPGAVVSR